MNTPRDYDVCTENPDGRHGPIEANWDPEIADTHVSVACAACGTTTGFPIAAFAPDLDWN